MDFIPESVEALIGFSRQSTTAADIGRTVVAFQQAWTQFIRAKAAVFSINANGGITVQYPPMPDGTMPPTVDIANGDRLPNDNGCTPYWDNGHDAGIDDVIARCRET